MSKTYSSTHFPKRLFVLGAGPSLELLYPYREEMFSWGEWAIQRSDLVQPFLEFINPLYTIRYWADGRSTNIPYGISLDKPMGPIKNGGSIGAFISHFQKYGGKEIFLFGYDGDGSGYWRNQKITHRSTSFQTHKTDSKDMNKVDWGDTKIYHIGQTNNVFMTQTSISKMKMDIGLKHQNHTIPEFMG